MFHWRDFAYDLGRAFYAPRALYSDIRRGRRSPSWVLVAIYCLIYVIGTVVLHVRGVRPVAQPWIILDPSIYYLVQTFYETPLVFAVWIQGAGIAHVLGRLFRGRGSFDRLLTMTGYALWVPWVVLIPFDILPTPEVLYNTVLALCALWMVGLTALAVRTEEETGWPGAVISAVVACVVVAVVLFTYIR